MATPIIRPHAIAVLGIELSMLILYQEIPSGIAPPVSRVAAGRVSTSPRDLVRSGGVATTILRLKGAMGCLTPRALV